MAWFQLWPQRPRVPAPEAEETRQIGMPVFPRLAVLPQEPQFWPLTGHAMRREFVVRPQLLPGTVISGTLSQPFWAPGLQGWVDTLAHNYFVRMWATNDFKRADSIGQLTQRPARRRVGARAAMRARPGTGSVWPLPRPDWTPTFFGGGER